MTLYQREWLYINANDSISTWMTLYQREWLYINVNDSISTRMTPSYMYVSHTHSLFSPTRTNESCLTRLTPCTHQKAKFDFSVNIHKTCQVSHESLMWVLTHLCVDISVNSHFKRIKFCQHTYESNLIWVRLESHVNTHMSESNLTWITPHHICSTPQNIFFLSCFIWVTPDRLYGSQCDFFSPHQWMSHVSLRWIFFWLSFLYWVTPYHFYGSQCDTFFSHINDWVMSHSHDFFLAFLFLLSYSISLVCITMWHFFFPNQWLSHVLLARVTPYNIYSTMATFLL